MRNVLAFDFGGTSLRGAILDWRGGIVATKAVPSAVGRAAECDPLVWWRALADLSEALAAESPLAFESVSALAISAFTRTQVFLDASGNPVRSAPTWHDTRSETVVDALRIACPEEHPERARLNAFHPAARLLWLRKTEPDAFKRTRYVAEPKDFLNHCLTGRLVGDTVSSARLAAADLPGPDGRSVLTAAGVTRSPLPPLQDPVSIVGPVLAGLPGALGQLAGRPVIAMANDTWAAVVGLGALRAGVAYNISGTSEVFGLVSESPAAAEGLLDIAWGPGLHQLGGPGQNGADALTWALEQLGRGHAEIDALLERPLLEAPIVFLPYLQGERTPFWDASLRGAFVGLSRHHSAGDVIRAVMEGVAFVNRVVLERAEAAAGIRAGEIRFGGGGALSEAWCRIKADILGRDVVALPGEEAGLAGAAIVARTACGEYATLVAAQDALARPTRRLSPDPIRAEHYARLFAEFLATHQALAPISRRLASWAVDRP